MTKLHHRWELENPEWAHSKHVCKVCGAKSTMVSNSRGRGKHREYWVKDSLGHTLVSYAPPCLAAAPKPLESKADKGARTPTEAGGPDALEQERDRLRAVNAELLEALEMVIHWATLEGHAVVDPLAHVAISRARAAIAKAKGAP